MLMRFKTSSRTFADPHLGHFMLLRAILGLESFFIDLATNARPEWHGAKRMKTQTGPSIPRLLQADRWTRNPS